MKKIQTKKSFFKIQKILFFSFIALSTVALLFTLFHNLGNNAIADWDEARHGINAYEMVRSNNWIINTYYILELVDHMDQIIKDLKKQLEEIENETHK